MPPTGGVTSVIVRPARSSPVAWTVTLSGPLRDQRRRHAHCRVRAAEARRRRSPRRARRRRAPMRRPEQRPALHSVLLIISGDGRRGRDPVAGLDRPRSTIACSLPRLRDLRPALVELGAIELVDDRRAVALEDRFGRHEHDVRARARSRCAPRRSCRDESADRLRAAPDPDRNSAAAASRALISTRASIEMLSILRLEVVARERPRFEPTRPARPSAGRDPIRRAAPRDAPTRGRAARGSRRRPRRGRPAGTLASAPSCFRNGSWAAR